MCTIKQQYPSYELRQFNDNDANELYQALLDKRIAKHMATDGITLHDCQQIITQSTKHWQKHGIGDYAVVDCVSKLIIGWAGFKYWQDEQFEILIVLSPKYWGLGHAIYLELIDKAKTEFKLDSIYALLPESRKSSRLMKRLGFIFCERTEFNGEPFRKFVRSLS